MAATSQWYNGVAATEDGLPKVTASYASESRPESWKKGDLKSKMMLMRLRVKETPKQLALFGWNAVQYELIPAERDRDHFFPQYVPIREGVSSAKFCVTCVPNVKSFRQLPDAVKADPPRLTTGLLFEISEKEHTDPYQLSQEWFGSHRTPEVSEDPGRASVCST